MDDDGRERKGSSQGAGGDMTARGMSQSAGALEQQAGLAVAELARVRQEFDSLRYAIAHDLRAPLRAIVGFAKAVLEDDGPSLGASSAKALDRIVVNGERMTAMIAGLVEMGRLAQSEVLPTQLDLTGMASDIVGRLQAEDPTRSIRVEIQPRLEVRGDSMLVRQLLHELLENALKFTGGRSDAMISFGCSRDDTGGTVFFVTDNGAGFDAAFADRLFGVFQRLHRPEDFPGVGTGLATARLLVLRHGGRIWAESRPGQGATFFFTLPGQDP